MVRRLVSLRLVVGVNVSFRQFRKGQVLGATIRALKESGLAPRSLVLEMTESTMLHDEEDVIRILLKLKELGVVDRLGELGFSSAILTNGAGFKVKLKL